MNTWHRNKPTDRFDLVSRAAELRMAAECYQLC